MENLFTNTVIIPKNLPALFLPFYHTFLKLLILDTISLHFRLILKTITQNTKGPQRAIKFPRHARRLHKSLNYINYINDFIRCNRMAIITKNETQYKSEHVNAEPREEREDKTGRHRSRG